MDYELVDFKDKIFADGFSFKTRENQPDFVVGRLSIKVEDYFFNK